MSESELEKKIEDKVNERLNSEKIAAFQHDLKALKRLLEMYNRENDIGHDRFEKDVVKIVALLREGERKIEKLEEKTWWTMLVDWLAGMVKKKESILIPIAFSIAAFGQKIYELIISLLQ